MDIDLENHLKQLKAKELTKGGDWDPFPPVNLKNSVDFVSELLVRYLNDLSGRMKKDEQKNFETTGLLRKMVKLDTIDFLIMDIQTKATELISEASIIEQKLIEE